MYSIFGFNAIATFAGNVQGVVVQIIMLALSTKIGSFSFVSSLNSNLTNIESDTLSLYSTSASAKAV